MRKSHFSHLLTVTMLSLSFLFSSCQDTIDDPLDSGEETVDPDPGPGIEEVGDVNLSFSTRVEKER
ncbi:hypothetical protein, partial [Proteiniphilum sp. UBA5384]|uniref:hypothetical protein n=1 Tax=Proteiniphilum sp. UBA5384 TaxID=1947279 RepID=UPI0025E7F279